MKLLINKTKSEKRKKKLEKYKQLEILLVRIKYADKPDQLARALKELNKIKVVNKNLHEIKNEILLDYVGEFEIDGFLKVDDQVRQTVTKFENMDNFEAYIISIDQDYDSEDTVFNGYIYKLDTSQFKKINRSQCGNGCDFKHEIIEYRGKNFYIPTKGFCFVKCINFLTGEDYKQQYLDFIGSEQRRSNILTRTKVK